MPALLLCATVFLAPAAGSTTEYMLQDTLKSIVVSVGALLATMLWFRQLRRSPQPVAWHAVIAMPLALMAYALGSMAWSHTYLAGVEAVRWFVFALIAWLVLNTSTRAREPWFASAVFAGAVVASLWAVLQFWGLLVLFPQGPPPASTFVNRNFFAEFAVCALPFGAVLLARSRRPVHVALLSLTLGLVITAVLMTGARSALAAMWLQLLVLFPLLGWLFRAHWEWPTWPVAHRWLAPALVIATVVGLGLVPTGDATVLKEGRGTNALERGFKRTASISSQDPSLGIRMTMWRATLGMVEANPLAGVGAGAWENEVPLYQLRGSQLETDYYVHNEFLQLVAEYGVVGWLVLLALLTYYLESWKRALLPDNAQARDDAPWRAVVMCSLTALAVVSCIGFPWRLASTGALFALCLGALGACDLRSAAAGRWSFRLLAPSRPAARAGIVLAGAGLVLAALISTQAALAERDLVRATRIAMTISASPNANDPRWDERKREMLALVTEGIAINPHYRKVTPIVADELARWGDWRDAIWIWESVLASRPHVVAIMANVARGYTVLGDYPVARQWLARAQRLQPDAPSIRSLEVILLARTGGEARALMLVRKAIADNLMDYDMANTGFALAVRAQDYDLAVRAMQLRIQGWPESAASGYVQLGNMYASSLNDDAKARDAFRKARSVATPDQWRGLGPNVPERFRAAQTSASKG